MKDTSIPKDNCENFTITILPGFGSNIEIKPPPGLNEETYWQVLRILIIQFTKLKKQKENNELWLMILQNLSSVYC